MTTINELKEEGNKYFKDGQFEEALALYTEALTLRDTKDHDKAVVYKNRAAVNLKLKNYNNVIDDASQALAITPNDPKALFRRCQAYEHIEKLEEAYKDAGVLLKLEPKNKDVLAILQRLNPVIQQRVKQQNSTTAKVCQMLNMAFGKEVDKEKQAKALNNLIVLAREDAGALSIIQEGGLEKLARLLTNQDASLVLGAIRVLSCVALKNKPRAQAVVTQLGLKLIGQLFGLASEEICSAAAHLLQNIVTSISAVDIYHQTVKKWNEDKRKGDLAPHPQFMLGESEEAFINMFFKMLIKMLDMAKVSAFGRDSVIELLIRNVTTDTGIGWCSKLMETDAITKLLTAAGSIKQHNMLPVTDRTRMHASVALSKIYDDLLSDQLRDKYKLQCREHFLDLCADDIMESKIEAIEAVSSLLQGPFEVGNAILSVQGITEMMLALADSENQLYQRVAVEAIVHSASKKEKCTGLLMDAIPILKKLYKNSMDPIKVRALVGLCKLGSFGGTDASTQPMEEGSKLHLAKACRKFLKNTEKDKDLRKWATEGLAFLTLDADVKEAVIDDKQAIQSIIDLAKMADKNLLYASVTVFVNLTNSYDTQDIMPELAELAKFSKHHVPEEHEKDKYEYIQVRIQKLAKVGVVEALVFFSKTDSKNSRELISRVFVALATEADLRGLIVQQGGTKALLQLSQDGTDAGKMLAAHAIAKTAVTMDPHTAFPGQRIYEIVRPLLSLLHMDRSGLQNFEALLALTNLASVSDSVRKRIVTEKGVTSIEHYMFEEHEMIKRAATECMCNMVMNEEVVKRYEAENDRVKLMLVYSADEDEGIMKAASGAIAILSASSKICERIITVKTWCEILQTLVVNEATEIQHRGCFIVNNMMAASKEIAEKVVESQLFEVLMALSKLEIAGKEQVKESAKGALDKAVKLQLIKPFAAMPTLPEEKS